MSNKQSMEERIKEILGKHAGVVTQPIYEELCHLFLKEISQARKEEREKVVEDLDRWHIENGYDAGTWVEAKKYLKKRNKK